MSQGSATFARLSLWFRAGQGSWPARNHRLKRAKAAEPCDMIFFLTYLQLCLPTSQPPPNVGRVSNSTPFSPTQPPQRPRLPSIDADEGGRR